MVFIRAFESGPAEFWNAITNPSALHALQLTCIAAGIAVVANTVFGIACALVLVRMRPRGGTILNTVIDLPFALSPVVVGLALMLTYGVNGWFGTWLNDHGLQVIFSLPGIVLATVIVTVPFVVREVIPVLVEIGDEQEQAATTLGANGWTTFWRITLPSIRWGVAYGVVLTVARALGEYGAVAVVSGRISGQTETMTIHIEERYQSFDPVGTFGAAVLLAIIALLVLGAMMLMGRGQEERVHGH